MQLFISWSGDDSKRLASAFRDWIPVVLQAVDPFMSSKDINLGSKWNETINSKLEKSAIGLIFVTPSNINSPWLNFESGALSKSLNVTSRVVPIVFGEQDPTTLISDGPLKQFQSMIRPTKENFFELIKVINKECESSLPDELVRRVFDKWWDMLDEDLQPIIHDMQTASSKSESNNSEDFERKMLLNLSNKMDELTYRTNAVVHSNSMNSNGFVIASLDETRKELESIAMRSNLNKKDSYAIHSVAIKLDKLSTELAEMDNINIHKVF